MAALADVDSVNGWSKMSEQRLPKPKLPGCYVHQSSADYPSVSHFGSADEDADSLIEVLQQDEDSAVEEVKKTLNKHRLPAQKTPPQPRPRPSKAPTEERAGGKGRKEISDFKETVARSGGEREDRPVPRKNGLEEPSGSRTLKKPRSGVVPETNRNVSADSGELSGGTTPLGANSDSPVADHHASESREILKKKGNGRGEGYLRRQGMPIQARPDSLISRWLAASTRMYRSERGLEGSRTPRRNSSMGHRDDGYLYNSCFKHIISSVYTVCGGFTALLSSYAAKTDVLGT
eukprot:4803938-Amphidinium_carterae.1